MPAKSKLAVEMKVEHTQNPKWLRLRGVALNKVTVMMPTDLLPDDKIAPGTVITVTFD